MSRPEGDGRKEGDGSENDCEMAETTTIMADQGDSIGTSYRSKLMNLDRANGANRRLEEITITDEDYTIAQDGDIPSIEFSKEVRGVLLKGMEKTLVIKLLGRSITYRDLVGKTQTLWQTRGSYQLVDVKGNFYFATFDLEEDYTKVLRGGPWMIFGAYLTVQPWSLDFDSSSTKISKVVAWIRIPGLSFRYYHKSTLRAIGNLLGEVVKIDCMTETRRRGKYARIAVLIDLQSPLVPRIEVDGWTYGVEYEGLPLICFECGKYGHTKEKCRGGLQHETQVEATPPEEAKQESARDVPRADNSISSTESGSEKNSSLYGSWMLVRYPKKAIKTERFINWRKPTGNAISLNCDGARKSDSRFAGAGSLLRDHEGRWIAGCCRHIGNCTSLQAELWALMDGLQLAWDKGFREVDVQIDCLVALNLVLREEGHANANMSLIQKIQRLLGQDWLVTVSHTYREGNQCADFLATYALNLALGCHVLEEPPFDLQPLLLEDAAGFGRARFCHSTS